MATRKQQTRIAVIGRKGGTGKTTVSISLASVYADQGLRVLVLDLDPQSNAAHGLGTDPGAPGTVELLRGEQPAPSHASEMVHVLPGNGELLDRTIQDHHPDQLAHQLATDPRWSEYDVLVFDCPPGNERLELQAITAAHSALVIVDAHKFALTGAARAIACLEEHATRKRGGVKRWAIVMNRADQRRIADREWTEQVRKAWHKLPCFELRQDAEIARATNAGSLVMDDCPNARAVQDVVKISRWVRDQ